MRYSFCRDSASWLNSRDEHELFGRLSEDFETLTGKCPLDFDQVADELRDVIERES